MALKQTRLFEDRDGVNTVLMGVEWDDATLQVTRFAFRIDVGNRNERFTLTRLSDNNTVSHDFIPGVNYVPGTTIFWNPPFAMAMKLYVNPKTSQTVGLPDGWQAELTGI